MKKLVQFRAVLVFVLVCLCVTSAWADSLTQDQLDSFEQYLKTHMERFGVPGMSAVVVADGQIIYAKGFGVRKAGESQAVDVYTDFQIASVSKNFTALAITQLQERGLLSVNDLVTKHLPWFATEDAERSKTITIKHLLQHTSGIPTTAYGLEIKDGTVDQLEEQVKRVSKIKLTADPGQRHQYSNLNYWTLALIVEKVSGMKFADYMEINVFEPLEMTRTGYINMIKDLDNVAAGHRWEGGKANFFDYSIPGTTIAAGGVYTNAMDMGNYIIALLNNGTYKDRSILSPESFREMTTDGALVWNQITYGYGFMMRVEEGIGKYIQHGGDNPNYTADFFLIPEKNIGFAIFSNSQHSITHEIGWSMKDIIYGVEPQPVMVSRNEAADASLTRMISYGQYLLVIIMAVWLAIVLLGMAKGKYTIFKKVPSPVRFVVQIITLPAVCLTAAFFLFKLPITAIGSLHIALLYKPDLVGIVLNVTVSLVIFACFIGLMGFVSKTNLMKKTKSA